MARQGLTKQQIIEAIKVLETEGKELTVTALRDRLRTGSFSTISSVLVEWRKEQAKTQEKPVPDIPESVSHLLRQLWKEAWQSADSLYGPEREAYLRDKEEQGTVKVELSAEISRLEGELEQALGREESSRGELEKYREEARTKELKLVKMEGSLHLLEEQERHLRAENKRLQGELTAWVERATRAEAKLELVGKEKKPRK